MKILFLTFKSNRKEYFNIKDIIEIDINKNGISKFLAKILSKSRYSYYFIKNILKKEKDRNFNIKFSKRYKKIRKLKCKKILVQHGSWEFYQETNFKNQPKLAGIIREHIDCFVFLSKYDQQKFVKELNLDINKTKVIRHCCEIELLKNKKSRNKKLIIIARLDNKQKRLDLAVKRLEKITRLYIRNLWSWL